MFTRRMFRDIWDTCDPSSEVLMGRSLDGPLGWTGSLKTHNQPRSRWNHFRWSNRSHEMTAALLRSHVCIWRSWDSSPNLSSLLYRNDFPGLVKPQLKIGVTSPGSHKSFAKSPSLNPGICWKWEPLPFSQTQFDHGCARNPRMEGYRCRYPHACLFIPEAMKLPTALKSGWSQPHSLVLCQWQDCPFKKPVQIGLSTWICKNSW